jgi:hypothetical protein
MDAASSPDKTKAYIFIGAAAVVVLLVILFLIFSGSKQGPSGVDGTPAQAAGGSQLQPAPTLSESPLLHPERPIGIARDVAGVANDRVDVMEDIHSGEEAEEEEAQ